MDFSDLRDIDVRTADPSALADIEAVRVDADMPMPERMRAYIRQIGNPYCFRCGKTVVKLSFADTPATLEERMEGYFRSLP